MTAIVTASGDHILVDDEDYEMLSRWSWYSMAGYAHATTRGGGLRPRPHVSMHRLLMLPDPDQCVDHINGDGLDNRRSNLRICTRSQNQWNRTRQRNNSSGYKGVHRFGPQRWQAQITVRGRVRPLGVFSDPADAAVAYDAVAGGLHGEFAKLNFPGVQHADA